MVNFTKQSVVKYPNYFFQIVIYVLAHTHLFIKQSLDTR